MLFIFKAIATSISLLFLNNLCILLLPFLVGIRGMSLLKIGFLLKVFSIFFIFFVFIPLIFHQNSIGFNFHNFFIQYKIIFFSLLIIAKNFGFISSINDFTKFNIIWFTICISFILFLFSFLFNGFSFRFVDILVNFGVANSVYFSVILVVLASYSSGLQLLFLSLLILLNASGTGLVGLIAIYFFRYVYNSRSIILFLVLLISVSLFFYFGQNDRSRSVLDLMSIDRFVISKAYIEYSFGNSDYLQFLFGRGFASDITPMVSYIDDIKIIEYLMMEGDYISSQNLHSEYLRNFNSFGIIGLIIILVIWFRFIGLELTFSMSLMGLFGSVFYITPVFFIFIIFGSPREPLQNHKKALPASRLALM